MFPVLWEWEKYAPDSATSAPPQRTTLQHFWSTTQRIASAILPAGGPSPPTPGQSFVPNPVPVVATVPPALARLERAHAGAARAICGTAKTAATACCLREANLEPLHLIAHRHMMSIEEKMARSGAQTATWIRTEGPAQFRRPLLSALPYSFPDLGPDASIAKAAVLAQKVAFYTQPGKDTNGRKLTKMLALSTVNGKPVQARDSSRDRQQAYRDDGLEQRWREEDLEDRNRYPQLPDEFEWNIEDGEPDPPGTPPEPERRRWQPPTYTVTNQSVLAADNDRRLVDATRSRGPLTAQMWTDGATKRLKGMEIGIAAGAANFYVGDNTAPVCTQAWPAGVEVCSYTAECVGAIEGFRWLLSDIGRQTFPTPGHLLWATDSRSLLQALEKGVLDQTDYMEAMIWSCILKLADEGWKISAVFVFSHVGTAKNESVDATAERYLANVSDPETVRVTQDGNWWRDNARRRHKAYVQKFWSTEGTAPALGSVAKSYAPKAHTLPFAGLSAKGTCLLAQVRTGVCARVGILTEFGTDCPRCGERGAMGREARGVEHMFTCSGGNGALAQCRDDMFSAAIRQGKEVTPKLLWSYPYESVQFIECFATGEYNQGVPEFEEMHEQAIEGEFHFVDEAQRRD